jgi:hypothetical protein
MMLLIRLTSICLKELVAEGKYLGVLRNSRSKRCCMGESEQKVALGEGENGCRIAGDQSAVDADFVGFGVDLDFRSRVVV